MRVFSYYIYLFLLLLGGGHYFYANPNHDSVSYISTQNLSENQQEKFTNKDQNSTLIEDTEFDFEDDYFGSDEIKENNKLFDQKFSFLTDYYSNHNLLRLNYYSKKQIILPLFCKPSSPIYITQRVLRI